MRPQCTLESGSESKRERRAAVCWGEKRHYGVMKNEKGSFISSHWELWMKKRTKNWVRRLLGENGCSIVEGGSELNAMLIVEHMLCERTTI